MENFITVLTFNYPHEASIIRGRLESEGIICFLKDELSVQINPMYSNALGGVKLQVLESDFERAVEILKDGGYLQEESITQSKIYDKFDKATLKIPFIKKLQVEARFLIIMIVSLIIIAVVIYFLKLPSHYERLTSNRWCVDYAIYNGKTYVPETNESFKIIIENCSEVITFSNNGKLLAPGFHTQPVKGNWEVDGKYLKISNSDTLGFFYDGKYEMNFTNEALMLYSDESIFYCHTANLTFNF